MSGGELLTTPTQSTAYYYTTDHLGSVRQTLASTGAVTNQLEYGLFGKSQDDLPISSTPAMGIAGLENPDLQPGAKTDVWLYYGRLVEAALRPFAPLL